MAVIPVRCPSCESDTVVKRGKKDGGKQRYLCQNAACRYRTFLLDYTNRGYMPSVKRLCSRCLWIDEGRLRMDGPVSETIHAYLTPSGAQLHEKGLEPTVAVDEPDIEFGQPAPTSDPILDKALERLTEKKAA